MKLDEDFKIHCGKKLKNFNSYVFYFFVINDVRILKIIVEIFEKVQFLCIRLFCDEMMRRFQKSLSKNFDKKNTNSYVFHYCDEMMRGF